MTGEAERRRLTATLAEHRRRRAGAPDAPAALEGVFACLDALGISGAPEEAAARSNYGERLRRAGRLNEAEAHQRKAVAWAPEFGGARYNLGVLLLATGRGAEAVAAFAEAERLMPDFVAAAINLAAALRETGDAAGAAAAARRALSKGGGAAAPAAWANLAAALLDLEQAAAAAAALSRALALGPQMGEAWANLAAAFKDDGRDADALTALGRALVCGVADSGGVLAQKVQLLRRLCRWDALPETAQALREMAAAGASTRIHPWIFLGLGAGRAAERAVARRYVAGRTAAAARRLPPRPAALIQEHGPLRVGYLSGDFQEHATALLLAEALERHDRRRVTVHAYSYGADDGGAMRRRLTAACDRFVDVRPLSHADAAARIAADGVRILVDLKGHTQGARLMIPALRPAPIQAQWLGYPGAMGADFIDYLLADATVAPFAHQNDYDERIVHLPGCYQPNDSGRLIDSAPASRTDYGLPVDGFVFCCFNAAYKISPQILDSWCEILRTVEGSTLWLLQAGPEAAANLRREAARRGVDGDRLIFAPRREQAAYLAQYRLADLFLDTWPVGAHTTAGDALWAGAPVLTRLGEAFAGRVGASLLRTMGLDDLIVDSAEQYVSKAIWLADNPYSLAEVRARAAAARGASGVFDGARFARGLESAYETMWARHAAGLPPAPFAIKDGESEGGK